MSDLANQNKEELDEMAMVDMAHAILSGGNDPVAFADLMQTIREAKGMSEEEAASLLAQLYTEMNIDGRFVHVGDGLWGLKKWYPIEQFDEPLLGGGRGKKADLDDDYGQYDDYDEEDGFDEVEDDEYAGEADEEIDLGEDADDEDTDLDETLDEEPEAVDAFIEDEELPLDDDLETDPIDAELEEDLNEVDESDEEEEEGEED